MPGIFRGVYIAPTPKREFADLLVEVLGCEQDPKNSDNRVVRLKVMAGEYSFTVDGTDDDGGWRAAAGNGAKKVKQWIKDNEARLVSRRSTAK